MTPAGEAVLAKATALVQRCERAQRLLKTVLDAADDGLYDPITDQHSLHLPGKFVRAMREALHT